MGVCKIDFTAFLKIMPDSFFEILFFLWVSEFIFFLRYMSNFLSLSIHHSSSLYCVYQNAFQNIWTGVKTRFFRFFCCFWWNSEFSSLRFRQSSFPPRICRSNWAWIYVNWGKDSTFLVYSLFSVEVWIFLSTVLSNFLSSSSRSNWPQNMQIGVGIRV